MKPTFNCCIVSVHLLPPWKLSASSSKAEWTQAVNLSNVQVCTMRNIQSNMWIRAPASSGFLSTRPILICPVKIGYIVSDAPNKSQLSSKATFVIPQWLTLVDRFDLHASDVVLLWMAYFCSIMLLVYTPRSLRMSCSDEFSLETLPYASQNLIVTFCLIISITILVLSLHYVAFFVIRVYVHVYTYTRWSRHILSENTRTKEDWMHT